MRDPNPLLVAGSPSTGRAPSAEIDADSRGDTSVLRVEGGTDPRISEGCTDG